MLIKQLRPNQKNKYLALREFALGATSVRSTPANLQIARSNRCNFRCVYCCDHRVGSTIPRTEIGQPVWEQLLGLIPNSESIAFHGISEFMIDPEFFDIVRRCGETKATLSINTNGSVCSPRHLEALASYPGHLRINFSMDAASPETYLRIRGRNFWRVVQNIKAYIEHFKERRDSTWISFSFVITRSSVKDMLPLVFLGKALKVDGLIYYRLHEYDGLDWQVKTKDGGIFDYREECTSTFWEEYNYEIERTRQAAKILGISVQLPAPFTEQELKETA